MAELFQRDRSVIGKHIRNVFKEGELKKESVWAKFAHTADDGKTDQVDYYNLDAIISVGYRVKSLRGTQFRIWAKKIRNDRFLPTNFILLYATTDTKENVLNKLISFCDKEATKLLEEKRKEMTNGNTN